MCVFLVFLFDSTSVVLDVTSVRKAIGFVLRVRLFLLFCDRAICLIFRLFVLVICGLLRAGACVRSFLCVLVRVVFASFCLEYVPFFEVGRFVSNIVFRDVLVSVVFGLFFRFDVTLVYFIYFTR